ncbi:MAG: glycosyltransferase family 2 protein [Beijerinckiaceae bacterium]
MPQSPPVLSVVIPAYNEGSGIDALLARLVPVLEKLVPQFDIIFIDDGSKDDTLARLHRAVDSDPRIRAISFSRNFGKEIAIAAGLDHATGDAVVIMDADLQHPPEVIGEFVAKWREGFANVYGVRRDRANESMTKRGFARIFYRLFGRFAETELPVGAGDFRLLDRKAVEALRKLGERARFSKGLYAWIGFKSVGVLFDVADRAHGVTKFSYRKLTRFAFDGLTSFSTMPLRVWTYIGVLISAFAITYAIIFLVRTIMYGVDVPGFPSLIVSVTFFSGVQLITLGVLGEYIGRIFAEVKRRPLYIIDEHIGFDDKPAISAVRDERRIQDAR